MNCDEVCEHLESFIDKEIGNDLKQKIARHLDVCKSCREDFSQIHSVSSLLKKDLPATPAKNLDDRVLAAFRQHHQRETVQNSSKLFDRFWFLKPAFALLTLCVLTSLSFWLGRATVSVKEVTVASPPQIIEKNVPMEVIKYIEVPIVKNVEIPIEKEKIVTRIVYQKIQVPQKIYYPILHKRTPQSERYETTQAVDLKDFQPISEISPKILKTGETNEK